MAKQAVKKIAKIHSCHSTRSAANLEKKRLNGIGYTGVTIKPVTIQGREFIGVYIKE